MYLTLSKRLEFSASHRLAAPDWLEEKNLEAFGPECGGKFGHGHNYTAFFVLHGPVDSASGIVANLSGVKERLNSVIVRYDHRFLNVDTPPFDKVVPSAENVAAQLLSGAKKAFRGEKAEPVACHLHESKSTGATAFADGKIERDFWLDFSAARRTYSPHLSEKENVEIFGQAASPSGHGHNYKLKVTLRGEVDNESGLIVPLPKAEMAIGQLRKELDHKNLNTDVPGLKGKPMTTEILSKFIYDRLSKDLPVTRVKLFENEDFFIEYHGSNRFFMGVAGSFRAAHRLHSPKLSDRENQNLYGKCNNPKGHGHEYRVECTVTGRLDEKSGTAANLVEVAQKLKNTIAEWDYKHLEQETNEFRERPSTGENILQMLWKKLDAALEDKLFRLRLWETPNNRFTLRREV